MEAAVVIYVLLSAGIILMGIKMILLILGRVMSAIVTIVKVLSRIKL